MCGRMVKVIFDLAKREPSHPQSQHHMTELIKVLFYDISHHLLARVSDEAHPTSELSDW